MQDNPKSGNLQQHQVVLSPPQKKEMDREWEQSPGAREVRATAADTGGHGTCPQKTYVWWSSVK